MRKIYSQETTRPQSAKQDVETTKNIPVYLPKTPSSSRSHQGVVVMMMMTMMMMKMKLIINRPILKLQPPDFAW